jgi:hypothetical protein
MPSVFPGMDPFLEGEEWEDFHARFINKMSVRLLPDVRPVYAVRTERRVYVEYPDGDSRTIRPDVAILRDPTEFEMVGQQSDSTVATIEPVERTLPIPFEVSEKYLVIRRLDTSEVVTVIELLSPFNKRPGAVGRETYLRKREEILHSQTNLVEIELLRGGHSLPTMEPLPPGDYFAFVCRQTRRGRADVYAWPMNHRLPAIPIPLSPNDKEVSLDLQAVFDTVYDEAGYDYSLNYRQPVSPPLTEPENKWVNDRLPEPPKDASKPPCN